MKVAVVTPAHDVAAWIGDCIASVIAQSHKDWAMIIVDDGSRDATARVAARFDDPRIALIRQENRGVSAARNRGLAAAAEDAGAVLFLDADDFLAPDALARLAAALEAAPRAVAAHGPFGFVAENAHPGARAFAVTGAPLAEGDLLERLLERNLFANGGHVLIRRAACAGFREDIAFGEDWEFWVRLAQRGPFAAVQDRSPVLFVRRRASGAYLRMATHPDAFEPVMAAIFDNDAMLHRVGTARRYGLRRRAEAENAWIVGRELVRHGRRNEAMKWLRRAITAKPSLKRTLLALALPVLQHLPPHWRGPFRPYD